VRLIILLSFQVFFAILYRITEALESAPQIRTKAADTLGTKQHNNDGQNDKKLPETNTGKHEFYLRFSDGI